MSTTDVIGEQEKPLIEAGVDAAASTEATIVQNITDPPAQQPSPLELSPVPTDPSLEPNAAKDISPPAEPAPIPTEAETVNTASDHAHQPTPAPSTDPKTDGLPEPYPTQPQSESAPFVTESSPAVDSGGVGSTTELSTHKPSEETPSATTTHIAEGTPTPTPTPAPAPAPAPAPTTATTTASAQAPAASSAVKSSRKPKTATSDVKFWIAAALTTLGLLGVVLWFVSDGLTHPSTKFLPLYIIGYRVFYFFFPHDWAKEKYYMSHLHLGLVLLLGAINMPVFSLNTEIMCMDSVAARHINMNSIAYFFVDTLVLIDTLWITHHFFSIGCALFGIAGVNQVLGGSVYVWYAEIGGLLYHISRMWPDSKLVRQIFLVCYFVSRVCMLWIASISWRCTIALNELFTVPFFIDLVLSCFTTGVALVNMKFLWVNYKNYVRRFGGKPKTE